MKWIKIGWVTLLAAIFLVFSHWYGGNGKPITPEEGAALLKKFEAAYANQRDEGSNFAENIADMIPRDDGKEFYAVNLEQVKTGAKAEQADRAYAEVVFPLLFKRASHPVFVSERAGLMLGEYGHDVDRVAVVRYRSLRDMIEMTLEPSMIDGSHHKFAALAHTEVFITRPMITFVHVRLILGLMLIIITVAGLKLINFISSRRG